MLIDSCRDEQVYHLEHEKNENDELVVLNEDRTVMMMILPLLTMVVMTMIEWTMLSLIQRQYSLLMIMMFDYPICILGHHANQLQIHLIITLTPISDASYEGGDEIEGRACNTR
jgi:hypothetical protein